MSHAGDNGKPRLGGSTLARMTVVAVFGCVAIAGCSSAGAPAPAGPAAPTPATATPSPTYSATLCSDAAEFQTAANAIVHLDAGQVGTDGVKAALENLGAAGRNLATAAKEQFGPQVASLEQALASLQTTTAGLSDQNSLSAKFGALASGVSNVEQAAKPIMDSVRTGCASIPPVETPTGS